MRKKKLVLECVLGVVTGKTPSGMMKPNFQFGSYWPRPRDSIPTKEWSSERAVSLHGDLGNLVLQFGNSAVLKGDEVSQGFDLSEQLLQLPLVLSRGLWRSLFLSR